MARLPCIKCGKAIMALLGRNTIYYPRTGKTYALCTGGCHGEGSADTDHDWAYIDGLSEDQRQHSEVPEEDCLSR